MTVVCVNSNSSYRPVGYPSQIDSPAAQPALSLSPYVIKVAVSIVVSDFCDIRMDGFSVVSKSINV